MCTKNSEKGCCHPERLKANVSDCSAEQIKKCHGDVEHHLCGRKHKEADK